MLHSLFWKALWRSTGRLNRFPDDATEYTECNMERSSRIRLAALIAAVGVALACADAPCAQNTDYSIMSWAHGVVIWPGALNTYLTVPEHFADRLATAAEAAFGFWGYDPPKPIGDWDYPIVYPGRLRVLEPHDVRIADDTTGEETSVPNLVWAGDRRSPLVVIAFVGRWRMVDALGETATFGARFHASPACRSYPDAEEWVHEVGRSHRTMICASYAGDDTLIHEFAHWFLYEWCLGSGIPAVALPLFVHEGVAETSSAHAVDPTYDAWERRAVIDWAEEHCLSDGVGAASVYTVGESLVTYLVGELGTGGFLDTLQDWIVRPLELIEKHEPGWRESLGLPGECGVSEEGSE